MPDLKMVELIVPAFVGLFAVWMTAYFSAKSAYASTARDRKIEAYSRIFEALDNMKHSHDQDVAAVEQNKVLPDDAQEQINRLYEGGRDRLREVLAREAWLLAPQVLQRAKQMNAKLDEIATESHRNNDFFMYVDHSSYEIGKAIEDMQRLAAKDIKKYW